MLMLVSAAGLAHAAHNEDAWEKRLPGALEFLFGQWQPPPERP